MLDCSKELLAFHDEAVRLPEPTQERLMEHRDANRTRLVNGLKKGDKPVPIAFLIQGSYDMETIIQHPDNDYDIDDGAIFASSDLQGESGELSPLDARQRVCNALQDDQFLRQPEVRPNCVRVFYQQGHHVDIPVYRQTDGHHDQTLLELASEKWRESNPNKITEWFAQQVKQLSADEDGKRRQLRRVVRLLKAFARSRKSWDMPSGLILSILVCERYYSEAYRDDVSFYKTIQALHERLQHSLEVRNPVAEEDITKSSQDSSMVELRTQLGNAIGWLLILDDSGCTRKAALQAWGKVFNTNFFDKYVDEDDNRASPTFTITGDPPKAPVKKEGGGRYG